MAGADSCRGTDRAGRRAEIGGVVSGHAIRVAWYRFRATFARRRGGYLSLVLLIGLVGGLAMAAVAAARRTQSSFPTYLASTNPSDLNFLSGLYDASGSASGYDSGYDPGLIRTVSHLPHVKRAESYVGLNLAPLGKNGAPTSIGTALVESSVDGEFFHQDRVTVTQGRLADPHRVNEADFSAEFFRNIGGHAFPAHGVAVPVGVYTNAQVSDPGYGTPSLQPHRRLTLRLVGVVKFDDTVVQDDVDANPFGRALFTPALTGPLLGCCVTDTATYLQLDHGSRDVAAVEAEIERVLPKGATPLFQLTSTIEAKTQQAIKPESIALGVFGGIAALAALLIAGQVIGRQIRRGSVEQSTLRALGAGPVATSGDVLLGMVGAVVVGSLLAGAVAVALSPLAPLGPVRTVYPFRGVAFDWTVLGIGVVVLVVALSALAVALGYRAAPHRVARRERRNDEQPSNAGRVVAAWGLPASMVAGLRFALEAGGGPRATPVRSAILGTGLALTVLISTVTFGASLDSLVSQPALYGWNWNYELTALGFGYGDMPQQPITQLLARDRAVAAWSGYYFGELQVDGRTEPIIGGSPHAPVGPPILSGHGFDAPNEVVLGGATLTALHKRLGDTVEVSNGVTTPTRLTIVGTATMPTVGQAGSVHPTMGTGALLSYGLIPASVRNPFHTPIAGPQAIFVRLRPGANPAGALHTLQRIAAASSVSADGTVSVLGVQRPAEIVNYRSMGTTPAFLGLGLAAGAVIALGLTLIASVRRRRRDLALLKTFGFTQRQLGAVVAWQSMTAVTIGTVVGVPLGIVVGRFLWDVFAREIHVVPVPTIPILSIALVTLGGLVLANVVAAVPGTIAARTRPALLLRAE